MINLLPNHQKKRVFEESRWRLLISVFSVLTIFILMILTVLFFLNQVSAKIITEEIDRLEERELELSSISLREGEIRAFNMIISDIDQLYRESEDVIEIIEDLRTILPSGSYLNSFRYEKSFDANGIVEYTITITGYAPEWQSLIEMERGLDDRFDDVIFSPGVWTQLSDIDFSINLKTR